MISISPIFKTVNDDPLYGQDIVDFLGINPSYGELQDLKDLTAAAKQEGDLFIFRNVKQKCMTNDIF